MFLFEDITKIPGKEFKPWPSRHDMTLDEAKFLLSRLGHYHGAWARFIRGHKHVSQWREGEEGIEPPSKAEDFGLTMDDVLLDCENMQKFFGIHAKSISFLLENAARVSKLSFINLGHQNKSLYRS